MKIHNAELALRALLAGATVRLAGVDYRYEPATGLNVLTPDGTLRHTSAYTLTCFIRDTEEISLSARMKLKMALTAAGEDYDD